MDNLQFILSVKNNTFILLLKIIVDVNNFKDKVHFSIIKVSLYIIAVHVLKSYPSQEFKKESLRPGFIYSS